MHARRCQREIDNPPPLRLRCRSASRIDNCGKLAPAKFSSGQDHQSDTLGTDHVIIGRRLLWLRHLAKFTCSICDAVRIPHGEEFKHARATGAAVIFNRVLRPESVGCRHDRFQVRADHALKALGLVVLNCMAGVPDQIDSKARI